MEFVSNDFFCFKTMWWPWCWDGGWWICGDGFSQAQSQLQKMIPGLAGQSSNYPSYRKAGYKWCFSEGFPSGFQTFAKEMGPCRCFGWLTARALDVFLIGKSRLCLGAVLALTAHYFKQQNDGFFPMLQQIVSNTAILKERFFRCVSIRTTNLVEGRPVSYIRCSQKRPDSVSCVLRYGVFETTMVPWSSVVQASRESLLMGTHIGHVDRGHKISFSGDFWGSRLKELVFEDDSISVLPGRMIPNVGISKSIEKWNHVLKKHMINSLFFSIFLGVTKLLTFIQLGDSITGQPSQFRRRLAGLPQWKEVQLTSHLKGFWAISDWIQVLDNDKRINILSEYGI